MSIDVVLTADNFACVLSASLRVISASLCSSEFPISALRESVFSKAFDRIVSSSHWRSVLPSRRAASRAASRVEASNSIGWREEIELIQVKDLAYQPLKTTKLGDSAQGALASPKSLRRCSVAAAHSDFLSIKVNKALNF
ncbi:MAG: hypothetical protein ACKOEW_03445 [Methylocystis sp.]